MNLINKFDLKSIFSNELYLGEKLFLIGVFFLPSALPIGGFFLLTSIYIAFRKNNENLIKNKWNSRLFEGGLTSQCRKSYWLAITK